MFTVIIPTRNRPAFLRIAVESALRQSVPDTEIIVVNDGTSPIEDIHGSSVRVLDNRQRGPVSARNLGVSESRRSFVAFLDDDDCWIDPDHLARAAEHLNHGAVFCFSDGIMRFERDVSGLVPADIPFARDADAKSLECDNTILISTVCYQRSLHDDLGSFDVDLPYYWDWDWYLRVARAGHSLIRIAQQTTAICVHQNNMSGDPAEAERRDNLAALARKHAIAMPVLKNHLTIAKETS